MTHTEPTMPAESVSEDRTEASKKVVLDFWRICVEARDIDQVERFLAPDLKQHNPRMADGIDSFRELARDYWKGQPKRPVRPELSEEAPEIVLAKDDLVLLMHRRPTPEPTDPTKTYDRFSFDLYRVANGMIVEHWDDVRK